MTDPPEKAPRAFLDPSCRRNRKGKKRDTTDTALVEFSLPLAMAFLGVRPPVSPPRRNSQGAFGRMAQMA